MNTNPFQTVAERVGLTGDLFRYLIANEDRTPAEQIAASDAVAAALVERRQVAGRPDRPGSSTRTPCPVCAARGWVGPSPAESEFCPECRGYKTIPAERLSCSTCQGAQFVRDPESSSWRVDAIPCPDCQSSIGAVSTRATSAGIPPVYSRFTMDRWDELSGEDPAKGLARDLVGTLIVDPSDFARQTGRPGILFHGPVGTGKTGLAVAAGLELMRQGWKVRFVVFDRLLDELRATYDSNDPRGPLDVWSRYLGADVLIVDDLGTRQDNAGWRTEQAYHLFDERLSRVGALGVTLVTTNLSIEEIAEAYDDRTASRLARLCFECPMEGTDLRRRDEWDA